MRFQAALAAGGLLVACAPLLAQAPPAPIINHTFEDNDGGWTAMGSSGKLSITHDAANVHQGKAALKLDYTIQKGDLSVFMLPVGDSALTKAKCVRFWIKADANAMLGVSLQEQDGGRYSAMFSVPKDKWQQVELAPADFVLGEDANDPRDPDNKLDLDKVTSIGLIDAGQIFAQTDNEQLSLLFNLKRGPHTLYLDDFTVTGEPATPAYSTAASEFRFDTFAHPQAGWFAIGDTRLSAAATGPLTGRSLQADYSYGPAKIVGIVRRIPRGSVEGMEKISFDVASTRAIRLLAQVEEKDGGKYNTIVDVPAGKTVRTFAIPFKELIAGDDSHDANNKLDMDQINQVVFVDISGASGQAESNDTNTLWIGNLKATK